MADLLGGKHRLLPRPIAADLSGAGTSISRFPTPRVAK